MASNERYTYGQVWPSFSTLNRLDPSGNGSYAATQDGGYYANQQNDNTRYFGSPVTTTQAPESYPSWLTDLTARGIGGDWAPTQGDKGETFQLISDFGASTPQQNATQAAQQQQAPANQPGWDTPYMGHPVGQSEAGSGQNANDGGGGGLEPSAGGTWGGSGFQSGLGSTPTQSLSDYIMGGFSGGFGTGDFNGVEPGSDQDTSQNTGGGGTDPADTQGGSDTGGADTGGADGGGYFKGGVITANRLTGPDPDGPDDGYGALKVGEGVVTAKAMRHYGPAFLAKLNKLAVPKK